MAAPRKYPDELRERATRMAVDLRRDPATKSGALKRVAEQLGINPETLRNWVIAVEADTVDGLGAGKGAGGDEAARMAELERENRELRRSKRSCAGPRHSLRRSSTARLADRRVHRHEQE